MIRHVKDLSSSERDAVEAILGRALGDGESVSVRPVSVVQEAPGRGRKLEIAAELRRYFERLDAALTPCAQDDLDAAIDEALEHARPSYRPYR